MTSLLLDANLSPATAVFLRTLGFDVSDLISRGLANLSDQEIVALAKREERIIVTFDLDFGEIYYRAQRGQIGVIILRLEDQTKRTVNAVLDTFFSSISPRIDLDRTLVVIDERRVRINT